MPDMNNRSLLPPPGREQSRDVRSASGLFRGLGVS